MLLPISKNFTKPLISIVLVIAYMLSFYLLTFALKEIPIAIAYSTWAGIGILLFTLFGYLFHGQSLQWQYPALRSNQWEMVNRTTISHVLFSAEALGRDSHGSAHLFVPGRA